MARVQSTPTVSLIQGAVIPKRAIRPIPPLYTTLSGVVALLIAAAAVVLIDYLDDTLKSARKVQDLLGIPVLGEIVDAAPTNKVKRLHAANQASSSLLNAFGILRIKVSHLIAQKSIKTLLITSPSLGEGKTTIATNLAAAFVRLGKKVVLMDADLYHPSLHARLGLDNKQGLTDILTGNRNWRDVLRDYGGMTIVTSGPQTASSAVLLESASMTNLLDQLQKEFDLIIIDGPPLFVEDSQILALKVGGTILVVRLGGTITAAARGMLDQLELMGAHVLGAALNRVPHGETYYFSGSHNMAEKKSEKPLEKVEAGQS